jgi:hypothetical protein
MDSLNDNNVLNNNSTNLNTKISPAPKKYKKIAVILLCVIAIVAVGIFAFEKHISSINILSPVSKNQNDQVGKSETLNIYNLNYNDVVQFIPREHLISASSTEQSSPEADWQQTITINYDIYKVGEIISGKYKGGELLLGVINSNESSPCKGPFCGEPNRVRYIKFNGFLYAIEGTERSEDVHIFNNTLLKNLGVSSGGWDFDTSLPIMTYPRTLGINSRATLKYEREGDGQPDIARLMVAFTDPVFGKVWTTGPTVAPNKSFYKECQNADASMRGVFGTCVGNDFITNNFYLLRPDGTYLVYSYSPDISASSIRWKDQATNNSRYESNIVAGCAHDQVAQDVVSPDSLKDSEIEVVGNTEIGDEIYAFKDKNDDQYKDLYSDYVSAFPGWYKFESYEGETKSPSTPVSYEKFLATRPIFLWRDPFGRMIKFVNTEYLPPSFCEPIIYLYPTKDEKVTIKIGPEVRITDSYPQYKDSWKVVAHTDGSISSADSSRKIPFLFWEGVSSILPEQKEGFVVANQDVNQFLRTKLVILGLNKKETEDFVRAWLPKFKSSPYYLFTFIDKSVIDKLAPISLSPQPDTFIRVLMDYNELNDWVDVKPQVLPATPNRNGFTVVEWGVLVR